MAAERLPRGLPRGDTRTPEQVAQHYAVERELADRLRRAPREERLGLYSVLYDELFRRVPSHPLIGAAADEERRARDVAHQLRILRPHLEPGCRLLELGAGDCRLAVAACAIAGRVDAIEVSDEIGGSAGIELPPNVRLLISDGVTVPVEPGSADVAFSHQLMEHLHPDDAREQLAGVHRALREGGRYVCLTPNRLTGPHDVSAYFDDEPTGFHLREYAMAELASLFRETGFARCRVLVGGRGRYAAVPAWLVVPAERLLAALPRRVARPLARRSPLRLLMGVGVVGVAGSRR